jgi:hypothetical protein
MPSRPEIEAYNINLVESLLTPELATRLTNLAFLIILQES